MIPHHVYYQLAIVGLLWLCIMLHSIWPSRDTALPQLRTEPVPLRFKRKRANEPQLRLSRFKLARLLTL